jgi:tripartite-type tricarboxylate transporter receptor subunit TctC
MVRFLYFLLFIISTPAFSQINIVSSSIPGGGSDIQARVIARHLGKHLSKPTNVNVINMQGAGGLNMTNWLYNVAEPNSHIGILTVNNDVIIKGILKDKSARYDLSKFKWLFSAEDGDDNVFVLWANNRRGLTDINLMRTPNEFMIGNQGPNNIQTYILEEIVGVKSKIIYGYKDVIKALQINEIDARFGTLLNAKSRYPQWLQSGYEIQPILQVGSSRRHPILQNVPNVREFTRNDTHKKVLDYYEKNVRLARLVFGPPGMSEEVIRNLVRASIALEKDSEFIEDAKKIEMEVNFIHYNETNILVRELLSTSPELLINITSK